MKMLCVKSWYVHTSDHFHSRFWGEAAMDELCTACWQEPALFCRLSWDAISSVTVLWLWCMSSACCCSGTLTCSTSIVTFLDLIVLGFLHVYTPEVSQCLWLLCTLSFTPLIRLYSSVVGDDDLQSTNHHLPTHPHPPSPAGGLAIHSSSSWEPFILSTRNIKDSILPSPASSATARFTINTQSAHSPTGSCSQHICTSLKSNTCTRTSGHTPRQGTSY